MKRVFFGDHYRKEWATPVEIPILKMESGGLAFSDHGRVWMPDEDSDKLHHGYGGGLCSSLLTKFH
ncbi:MAG: hypothetical protein ACXWWD_07945 [Chitinophagaceae bacterium]